MWQSQYSPRNLDWKLIAFDQFGCQLTSSERFSSTGSCLQIEYCPWYNYIIYESYWLSIFWLIANCSTYLIVVVFHVAYCFCELFNLPHSGHIAYCISHIAYCILHIVFAKCSTYLIVGMLHIAYCILFLRIVQFTS